MTSSGSRYDDCRIVWAGASQARDLADALSDGTAERSGPNLAASCIESKASLLVLSKRSSFTLASTATAHGFDRTATRSIVAAVGGGPHSVLAATIANWLSSKLDVPASAVCGYSEPHEKADAEHVLATTLSTLQDMDSRTVHASSPAAMVRTLEPGTLLVIGAPEGSWFQRRFFGPGARIRAMSSSGNIVVRHQPSRIYQVMQEPLAYGPNMHVSVALELANGSDVVVAEHGKLLGTVRAETMASADPDLELHHLMEDGRFLAPEDETEGVLALAAPHSHTVLPVIDADSRLVGCVSASDLSKPLVV